VRDKVRSAVVTDYGLAAMVRRSEEILTQLASGRPAQEIAHEFQ
jgi:hypothetical protein